MKNRKVSFAVWLAGVLLVSTANYCAAEGALGGLTPVGAEQAANKDGSIPAWDGNDKPTGGWSPGQPRRAHWAFKDEKPLYSIDASNVDKYADQLSPGQQALLRQTKGYRMDVYPTHRNCGFPDFVYENTKKNATVAKMAADGWSLQEAVLPGVPFSTPKSGVEAMTNFKLRYQGVGFKLASIRTTIAPGSGATNYISTDGMQVWFYPWARKGAQLVSEMPKQVYASTYYTTTEPVALAGGALIGTMYLGPKSGDAYYYFPGQRRVRRLPTYEYDAPQLGYENQYTVDQTGMFLGNLDRFDYRLAGKKELYVQYNAFGMFDPAVDIKGVLKPGFPDNAQRRYELHRVWVVEATLKPGVRHVAAKRTYFLDEDTWHILVAEDYDGQGKLWKVREGGLIPAWEIGACAGDLLLQYDLPTGRYLFDGTALAGRTDQQWFVESNEKYFNEAFFTPENLRALSDR